MAINTVVDWGRGVTPAEFDACQVKVDAMTTAGVTDGLKVITGTAVTRTWTTVEAANEWVSFVNSNFTPVPVSAIVETV